MSDIADNRTVLVTGSSRGIGRAIALRLARDGFDIAVHCRSNLAEAEKTAGLIREAGRSARILNFDVCDRETVRRTLEDDIAAHGAYWGVVVNAGINRDGTMAALSDDDWDSVLRTDLDGFYNVMKPCIMPMARKRRGRVVVMSSVSGIAGTRGQTNYSAAKAGLIGAAKALAMELASRGITVNAVAPGLIETDMITEENRERIVPLIPMRRTGRPEEVAAAVAFLMSDAASYITRAVIPVAGGLV